MNDGKDLGLGQFRASEFSNAVNHFAGFVGDELAEWQAMDVDEEHRNEEGIAGMLESLALLLRMAERVRDKVGYGGTFTVGTGDEVAFTMPLYKKLPDHIEGVPLDKVEAPKAKRATTRKAKARK